MCVLLPTVLVAVPGEKRADTTDNADTADTDGGAIGITIWVILIVIGLLCAFTRTPEVHATVCGAWMLVLSVLLGLSLRICFMLMAKVNHRPFNYEGRHLKVLFPTLFPTYSP